jgi:lipopolysaccharide transport system permease protein
MLGIFAFVFGHIFQSRWPQQPEGMPFWLMLYSGLIVFNIFAETISRATSTVRGYPASAVPPILRPLYEFNPLGAVIEATRAAVLGHRINWTAWLAALIIGIAATLLGFVFFNHARDEFADAL